MVARDRRGAMRDLFDDAPTDHEPRTPGLHRGIVDIFGDPIGDTLTMGFRRRARAAGDPHPPQDEDD